LTVTPFKLAAVYVGFGLLWVLLSDVFVNSFSIPTANLQVFQTVYGVVFIVLSGGLVHALAGLREQQVRETRDRLERANEQLRVIERLFRHNLKTEMNVVLGYIDIVHDQTSDEQRCRYLREAKQSSNQLISLSNKLHLIDQLDIQQDPNTQFDLVELVAQNLDEIQSTVPNENLSIVLPDRAPVYGDRSFGYALHELVENAVQHNDNPPDAVAVRIEVQQSDGTTTLRVSDNGPGIPDHEIEVLRAGDETALSHGSGLGLWLVKWLTHVNGGDIEFDNSGQGATVEIHLESVSRVEETAQELQSAMGNVVEDTPDGQAANF
jgi:signal transduction histidine kinase